MEILQFFARYDDETKNKNRNVTKPSQLYMIYLVKRSNLSFAVGEVPPEMRIFGANLTIMSVSFVSSSHVA